MTDDTTLNDARFNRVNPNALPYAMLRDCWPALARFVNNRPRRYEAGAWREMRRALFRIMKGSARARGITVSMTLISNDRGILADAWAPGDRWGRVRLALVLVNAGLFRRLLRRCSACGAFFLAKRAHKRPRSFCSDACRVRSWRRG